MGSKESVGGKQILVIEDHPESAELLKMILEDEGYRVKCVATGRAALQVFAPDKTPAFNPDLTLLDLRLPDMSGLEFVEELRKNQSSIPPIIILSADPPYSLKEAARSIGALSVRKPFDFDELFSAIERSLIREASA